MSTTLSISGDITGSEDRLTYQGESIAEALLCINGAPDAKLRALSVSFITTTSVGEKHAFARTMSLESAEAIGEPAGLTGAEVFDQFLADARNWLEEHSE